MARININTATIEELEDECWAGMGTQFGHNIIGIKCNVVKERFGKEEAERFFTTYQV